MGRLFLFGVTAVLCTQEELMRLLSLNLNRSIVVMAVDTVYVSGDPLHANFDRRRGQ